MKEITVKKKIIGGAALALLLTLVLAVPAGALTTWGINLHKPYQQWANESRISTPDKVVGIVEDATQCDGGPALGCTDGTVIWLSLPTDRITFYHEVGHIADQLFFTQADRDYLAPLLRTPYWWTKGQEAFADAYSLCARVGIPQIDPNWGYSIGELLVAGWRVQEACRHSNSRFHWGPDPVGL